MISEHDLSMGFHGFWAELLPLLTPAFVSDFNHVHMKRFSSVRGRAVAEPRISPSIRRHDLVAELAFHLARIAYSKKKSAEAILSDKALLKDVIQSTTNLFLRYEGTPPHTFRPDSVELQQSVRYSAVYESF